MKTIFFCFMIFGNVFANEKSLHSHEHGAVKLALAVEKNSVEMTIDGPGESFLGFEYAAKTKKEKMILSDFEKSWEKNLDSLIAFDKKLNCKIVTINFKNELIGHEDKKINKKEEGVHSDIEIGIKLQCEGSLIGTEVKISLKKVFKNIKKLSVDLISGETKSLEISNPVETIKL